MRISDLSDSEASNFSAEGTRVLSLLKKAGRLGNTSYLMVVAVWLIYGVIAAHHSGAAFARSGAGLVLMATFVSGIHLFIVDRSKGFFGFLRNHGMQDGGKTERQKEAFGSIWKNHLDAQKAETEVVSKVIKWEVALATLGTLVWGYGDLFVSKFIHCGEWQCSY